MKTNTYQATHIVTYPDGSQNQVMLRDNVAYTPAEWDAHEAADLELSDTGEWLFQGQPFTGRIQKITSILAAAEREGLAYFWAKTDVNGSRAFVAQSWEDSGFHVDNQGEPIRDARGNTVAQYSTEPLDPANPEHVALVIEWWEA